MLDPRTCFWIHTCDFHGTTLTLPPTTSVGNVIRGMTRRQSWVEWLYRSAAAYSRGIFRFCLTTHSTSDRNYASVNIPPMYPYVVLTPSGLPRALIVSSRLCGA